MSRISSALLACLLAVSTAACSIEVARNDDGSLQVDSSITEESLNKEIAKVLADRDVIDVAVELIDGHAQVTGFLPHPDGNGGDLIDFRLDVTVADGNLVVSVSEATVAGRRMNDDVVERWNAGISDRLERAADRHPHSTLEAVEVAGDTLAFSWRIDTRQSR
jgi:hypothetical protein